MNMNKITLDVIFMLLIHIWFMSSSIRDNGDHCDLVTLGCDKNRNGSLLLYKMDRIF